MAPAFDRRGINLHQEVEVGAGAIDAEKRDANSVLTGIFHSVAGAAYRFVAVDAVGLQLDLAGRHFDDRRLQAETHQFLDIAASSTREAPDLGVLQPGLQDERNGFAIFGGHLGESGFDAADAKLVQLLGDLQLLLRAEDDADGLLAVAQVVS